MRNVKNLSRKECAARTRQAIVRAAAEEFRSSGYQGATMAAIAKRAGVAVQTVYFVFHTKPLLLTATIDNAVMGDDPVPLESTPWWQEATTTADARRAIELFVAEVATISERAATLDRVARAAAPIDPEVVDVIAYHEALRATGFRRYIDTFVARGLLKEGLDAGEATDVLLTLAGSDVFLNFTEDRGWSKERYVTWATDALCSLLLSPN